MNKKQLVEIARSYSYKKTTNLGNYNSESVDFFCSQKAEVPEDEAEKTSEALYQFCKAECIKGLNSYLKEKKELNDFNDPNYYQKARTLEQEYATEPLKVWTPKPGEIQKIIDREVKYTATDKEGGMKKIDKVANTGEPY